MSYGSRHRTVRRQGDTRTNSPAHQTNAREEFKKQARKKLATSQRQSRMIQLKHQGTASPNFETQTMQDAYKENECQVESSCGHMTMSSSRGGAISQSSGDVLRTGVGSVRGICGGTRLKSQAACQDKRIYHVRVTMAGPRGLERHCCAATD